jgi:glycosyltransferase involved in cell wall biosynthesis
VVLSNSSAWCKGVAPPSEAVHVCYCLTPMRWAWRYDSYVEREGFGWPLKLALRPAMAPLRAWDVATSRRVQHFVAISREVAARIERFYGRDSDIIYPPVRTERFATERPRGDYYLVVSRLIPYKRVDLAIEAFNQLGLPLKVVGDGRDREALKARAAPNVELLGRVSDEHVVELVQGCRAFVFPGEEDFGIAPVEAQAAGRPVVAFASGGALDTVIDGETGVLFREQSGGALSEAVRRLESLDLDAGRIAEHARRFDASVFRRELGSFVERVAGERPAAAPVR